MSLEDGSATLVEFSAKNILMQVCDLATERTNLILCGGGRKNNFLLERINKYMMIHEGHKLFNLKMINFILL